MRSSRMNFIALYMYVNLAAGIGAIAVPYYAIRDEQDNVDSLQKKTTIPILKHSFEQSKEGYQYSYETGNGIHAKESGYFKNKGDAKNEIFVQQGSITYHDEQGKPITLTYVADEKGFRPQGEHLPIPPTLPDENIKGIEEITEHEEQEPQKEQVHPEQGEKEYVDTEQLKLAQREYQRQIQQQIQERFQHQYQNQQEIQPKQIY